MKKMIIMILLIFTSLTLQAPAEKQDTKQLVQKWQDDLFLEEIINTEFTRENLQKMISLLVKHPDIVYKQAILETGWFTSESFLVYNNCFGMKVPRIRPTTALGWAMKHARYEHWSESVYDYLLYQKYYEQILDIDLDTVDYYDFLKRHGYSENKKYIKTLRKL
jgi:uncharacterized FlgJ-related protein